MKATVNWSKELQFVGNSSSGHQILMDGDGGKAAASPMEYVLMAAGGCSSVDIISILSKARQQVTDCKVNLDAERAEGTPRVFTKIHLEFVVSGVDLSEKHVARAVQLSMEKYCSVSLMLGKSCDISHSYRIENAS
ncbi:OsmC family protein [Agarivorans sp. TSD2052]|uniref:OsmC family protein n=1 Tax=Agarivorans sp. TSD2052 TaxID=2937286 RepID=UPI00200BEEDD|nr:OsmC family protein [Agarivorans sp. TSD2052]UPW19170.1 OsmC family protein [Agarivorans sp. TSD2052]